MQEMVETERSTPPYDTILRRDDSSVLDVHRLITRMRRRWRLLAAVSASVFVFIIVVAALLPAKYSATARVQIAAHDQPDVTQPTTQSQPPPASIDTNAVDTRVEILKSPQLAAEVVRRLGLDRDPEFNVALRPPPPAILAALRNIKLAIHPPRGALNTPAAIEHEAVLRLMRATSVRRSGLTYVIDVSVVSSDPAKAARIANALAEQLIADQVAATAAQSLQTLGDINPHLSQLTAEVQAADAAVQEYKIRHNLMDANGATMAEEEVSNYDQQIALAKADYAQKAAAYETAQKQVTAGGAGANVSAALSSDTISHLRTAEADASRNLAELSAHYGDKYPDVIRAKDQLTDIQARIQQELDRILIGLRGDAEAARDRVASLESSERAASGVLAGNNQAQVGLLELQRRADALHQVYDAFLNASKQSAAEAQVAQPDARIASRAQVPDRPSFPNMLIVALAALVCAPLTALLVFGALEFFRDSFESISDVQERLNVGCAGIIPELSSVVRGGRGHQRPHRYLPDHPFSTFAEAFRSVRTFLMLAHGSSLSPKVIAITSALPNEGKTVTAFGLAQTFALAGSDTVLVDCDLRRRGVSTTIGGSGPGLVELLAGRAALKDCMTVEERSGAFIIRASQSAEAPPDLFTPEAIDRMLKELREHFEVVLLDTPPVLAIADVRVICAKADATLLIARWRRTPARASSAALELLFEGGADVAGVALTQVDMRKMVEGAYGGRYTYSKMVKGYYID